MVRGRVTSGGVGLWSVMTVGLHPRSLVDVVPTTIQITLDAKSGWRCLEMPTKLPGSPREAFGLQKIWKGPEERYCDEIHASMFRN
ncbi:hypothetical protein AVEN_273688-1, partial [Araneus ventricosus]